MTVTVIAEIGVNHNGDLELARTMVRAAADCGADIVKFQAFDAGGIAAAGASTADYQKRNANTDSQIDLLRGLELSPADFAELARECEACGVEFLATPFEPAFLPALIGLGMKRIKVASGELTNVPALRQFAATGLPVILSTGMATLDEVGEAVEVLRAGGVSDLTILHCTSQYPAAPEAINLTAMATMRNKFGCPVGYSDHSLGDHIAVAAVALGAVVLEKHFTLDRTLPGPDHKASLEPADFKAMVTRLRETATALGDGVKRPHVSELDTRRLVRRSWHAVTALSAGTVLKASDIALKRPLGGLAPTVDPVGRRLARDVAADTPIIAEDLA